MYDQIPIIRQLGLELLLQYFFLFSFSQDELGSTALIGACQNGHSDTVRVLLKHGAIVDKQNKVKLF